MRFGVKEFYHVARRVVASAEPDTFHCAVAPRQDACQS